MAPQISVHTVCLFITPSCRPVCAFYTIYHPTDFTVMNETKKKTTVCIILDFMLYLLYGQRKKKTHKTQKHYRCKAEVFFPRLYFFTQFFRKKVVFFNYSLTVTVMQNLGHTSVPFSEHKADSGYSFYVFIKGFQRWNYILLFSV